MRTELPASRRSRLPVAEIALVLVCVAAGIGIFVYAHRGDAHLDATRTQGERLIEALEAYRADRGGYPPSLEDLTPEYLASVEPPTWGVREWRYRRYDAATDADQSGTAEGEDGEYFQLSVPQNESGYPLLYYDVEDGRWVRN